MSENKNKNIVFILAVFIVIFMVIGGTVAYFAWIINESQKTNIVLTVEKNFSCAADGGGSITNDDAIIVPTIVNTSTSANYIKRAVKVTPTINEDGKTIYMDLWLDINKIDSGLSSSVNFKYAFTTSSTSNTTGVVSKGTFNGKVAGNKVMLLDGKSFSSSNVSTYYLWIWLDSDETSDNTMDQNFDLSLNGSCYEHISITANSLIKNANSSTLSYNDATDSQRGNMWTFSHTATEQVGAVTDYRYIGKNPNNYITFNNEVWRIIGVFDGRIKIIRDDIIDDISWDYKQSGVGSSTDGRGSNDWTDSQLMYMLNPSSYTLKTGYSLTGDKIYDGSGNIIYQLGCKPAIILSSDTSYSCTNNTWSLNSMALSQISGATYYLGGAISSSWHTAQAYYDFERGTEVHGDWSIGWIGLVGLMYPSDYAYTFANGVDNTCYTNAFDCNTGVSSSSWLYKTDTSQWTLSPNSNYPYYVFNISKDGNIRYSNANGSLGVRPVVYLKSDVKLHGSGTSSEPYEIVG